MKNTTALLRPLLLLAILLTSARCTDNDDNYKMPETFGKNSELYAMIDRVVAPESETANPLEETVCLDFVYPFQILIYDADLEILDTRALISDAQFSALLAALPADQSLSISYPITTTLANGDIFSVNNNEELKLAIDSCSREDIVLYCNSLFCTNPGGTVLPCVWNVKYSESGDNRYVSGVFLISEDGHLTFRFNNVNYTGTWIFEFVNDELHLNINLEGSSAVAADWNIDRKISLVNGNIVIGNAPKDTILMQTCQTNPGYEIGDIGPANGIVFYDKGSYSAGWRFMEVFTADLGSAQWGCAGSTVNNALDSDIGSGHFNTAAILNFHDSLDNFYLNPAVCNASNNGTVAAKNALALEAGNNGWFLPSENELHLVYANLHLAGIGNFSGSYWSSTEMDATHAKAIDFASGATVSVLKNANLNIKTIAVREF